MGLVGLGLVGGELEGAVDPFDLVGLGEGVRHPLEAASCRRSTTGRRCRCRSRPSRLFSPGATRNQRSSSPRSLNEARSGPRPPFPAPRHSPRRPMSTRTVAPSGRPTAGSAGRGQRVGTPALRAAQFGGPGPRPVLPRPAPRLRAAATSAADSAARALRGHRVDARLLRYRGAADLPPYVRRPRPHATTAQVTGSPRADQAPRPRTRPPPLDAARRSSASNRRTQCHRRTLASADARIALGDRDTAPRGSPTHHLEVRRRGAVHTTPAKRDVHSQLARSAAASPRRQQQRGQQEADIGAGVPHRVMRSASAAARRQQPLGRRRRRPPGGPLRRRRARTGRRPLRRAPSSPPSRQAASRSARAAAVVAARQRHLGCSRLAAPGHAPSGRPAAHSAPPARPSSRRPPGGARPARSTATWVRNINATASSHSPP